MSLFIEENRPDITYFHKKVFHKSKINEEYRLSISYNKKVILDMEHIIYVNETNTT